MFVWQTAIYLVMPMFGSEPWFEPEPAWTRPRFGPRFKETVGPQVKVQRNRWTEPKVRVKVQRMVNSAECDRTFLGRWGRQGWATTELESHFRMMNTSAFIYPNGALVCIVSTMASMLWAFNRIASVIQLFFCCWVWTSQKCTSHRVSKPEPNSFVI